MAQGAGCKRPQIPVRAGDSRTPIPPAPGPDRSQVPGHRWGRVTRLHAHLHGQLPLPLAGNLQWRRLALGRERGRRAGRAVGLGVLAGGRGRRFGAQPLGGFQLLPQQQVMPGLLDLHTRATGHLASCPRRPHQHLGEPTCPPAAMRDGAVRWWGSAPTRSCSQRAAPTSVGPGLTPQRACRP